MGAIYTIDVNTQPVTGIVDFFELVPADDMPLKVHAVFISQTSDLGDAQEEALRYEIHRGHSTTGSGGTAPSPKPVNPRSAAASFTAKGVNQTTATGGSPDRLHTDSFNIRVGLALILPPELRWAVDQGQNRLVIRLAAPADSLTMHGTLYVEEGA